MLTLTSPCSYPNFRLGCGRSPPYSIYPIELFIVKLERKVIYMGQIFNACIYDIDSKVCCTVYADKFHANCYSYSGAVLSTHYLLRQKPCHVMWGGDYVLIDDYLEDISNEDILLGISTYEDYEDFESNIKDIQNVNYYKKIKFIDENYKNWKHISVLDEAKDYFDYNHTKSVKYEGFLVNHTKKQAVNLKEYFINSKFFISNIEATIDLIPVLTETGGGTIMALFDGITDNSTEHLAEYWCGDLLQITDKCPDGYELIDCCISQSIDRVKYCYRKYGVNENGYVLKNENGDLFRAFSVNPFSEDGRGVEYYVKAKVLDDRIQFNTIKIEDKE